MHGEATSMPVFRPIRQHPMPRWFLNRPRPANSSHNDAAFFPTVLLHTTAVAMVKGIGSRGGRLGHPPGRGRGGRRRGSHGGSRGGGAQSSSPPPTRGHQGNRGRHGESSRASGQRHWIEAPPSPSLSPSPSQPSTPEPEPVDGFEFGVILNYGADQDSARLPCMLARWST
jgi:hypothetical protein